MARDKQPLDTGEESLDDLLERERSNKLHHITHKPARRHLDQADDTDTSVAELTEDNPLVDLGMYGDEPYGNGMLL